MGHSKNIVVVGGDAGVFLVKELSKIMYKLPEHHIVFVTGREFFYHIIGSVRATMTHPEVAEQICMPYEGLVGDRNLITYVYQLARAIGDGYVELDNGTRIQHAYCVVTTGKNWFDPLSVGTRKDEAVRQMTEYHGKLKEAQHILIVGGGGVGVEMAGDLAEAYPVSTGKTISLVHRRPKLLNDALCDKFRDGLANRLRDMGVHLYLNDQLDELDNETLQDASSHTWTTREGHRLENVDFVIRATQCKFNTGLLANLVPHLLSKNGVIVKSTFQLEGFENVFVMGDLADLPEQRSAMKHRGHASTVIANILALEGKGEFTDYRPTIEAMLVSLGTNGGMLTVNVPWFGPFTFGDWLGRVKARDVYVSRLRKFLGVK